MPMLKMTQMSLKMAEEAVKIQSTADAVAFLKNNPPFRTLKDVLLAADKQQRGELELKKRLVDGICDNHPENSRESVDRKVRNWFNGKTNSIGRDTAFELCLILGLSVQEANRFMMRVNDEAIHWRNPQEIVWGYALEHGLSYAETMELIDAAQQVLQEKRTDHASDVFTHTIRDSVLDSLQGTPEELLEFIAQKQEQWGSLHNQAHALFVRFMNLLEYATTDPEAYEKRKAELEDARRKNKDTQDVVEEKMSVDRVLDTYFFSRLLSGNPRKDDICRKIRLGWPDSSALSQMKNRSGNKDVSRKVLIMLFLATNGDTTAYGERAPVQANETTRTREQIFRGMYKRLNRMLVRCGFQPLDPRSPFDWIVLYCICVDDVLETDTRMNEILSGLFCGEECEEDDSGIEKK